MGKCYGVKARMGAKGRNIFGRGDGIWRLRGFCFRPRRGAGGLVVGMEEAGRRASAYGSGVTLPKVHGFWPKCMPFLAKCMCIGAKCMA